MSTSLLIARVTRGIDRKRVLLCMTGMMLLSGLIVALAPSYAVLMIGRALLGVTIGGFYSMSTATVMRLVPVGSVPMAIAIVSAGSALAVTRGDVGTLSILLLAMGVTGLIGTLLVGSLLQRSVRHVLVVIPILMSGIAIALTRADGSIAAVALLLAAWGLLGTPAPVGWGTWLARTLPADAEAGGGLMGATIQFAITLGAGVGGVVLDSYGSGATFGLSSGVLALAALLALLAGAVSKSGSPSAITT